MKFICESLYSFQCDSGRVKRTIDNFLESIIVYSNNPSQLQIQQFFVDCLWIRVRRKVSHYVLPLCQNSWKSHSTAHSPMTTERYFLSKKVATRTATLFQATWFSPNTFPRIRCRSTMTDACDPCTRIKQREDNVTVISNFHIYWGKQTYSL